jgi:transcriptional regulator with XRE-family HTH domain
MGKPATDIDRHCSARVKLALRDAGVTQVELSNALGVTQQQVGKMVNGKDRMSAGTLHVISILTKKPVGFFFVGLKRR